MTRLIPSLLAVIAWLPAAASAAADGDARTIAAGLGDDAGAEAIVACARANAPDETFAQRGRLETVRPDGDNRTLYIRMLAQRSEHGVDANLRVLNPPDLTGMAFLVLAGETDDAMFTYVPALRRTRRVTGSATAQSLWGTDFSYADVRQLVGSVGGSDATRQADGQVAGHPTYRLRATPAADSQGDYAQAMIDIRKQDCVPLGARFLDSGGNVLRELIVDADSITDDGERRFASRMTMHDRTTGSRTNVELSRVEFDESIPRRAFHPRGFQDVD